MEIKKRLGKIQKRMTPFIEEMNIGSEMKRMCKRFEDLLDYGEFKEEKDKLRRETGMSQSMRIDEERRARAAEMAKIHAEEAEEMLADQEQHKAQPEAAEQTEMEQRADKEAEESRAGRKSAQADKA